MADRVSASITIGGNLPVDLIDNFIAEINAESLSLEYDGEPFDAAQIKTGEALTLFANEVAWGNFEILESFCRDKGLPYTRWYGACAGAWASGRSVYRGHVDNPTGLIVEEYDASDGDHILMDSATARSLGSFEAVMLYFENADFEVPPLVISDATASPQMAATAVPA